MELNLKPTEAVTAYSLIVTGVVGSIGTIILARSIKDKEYTSIKPLIIAALFTIAATAGSVYVITKSSK